MLTAISAGKEGDGRFSCTLRSQMSDQELGVWKEENFEENLSKLIGKIHALFPPSSGFHPHVKSLDK